jgi:hypothetical protein
MLVQLGHELEQRAERQRRVGGRRGRHDVCTAEGETRMASRRCTSQSARLKKRPRPASSSMYRVCI